MTRLRPADIADGPGGRHRAAVVGVVALAVLLRLAWVLATDVDPRRSMQWDMTFYDLAALRFVDGAVMRDFAGVATAKWSPGYPILLGTAYTVFGAHLLVAKLLNVVLAAVTVAFTYGLGARLFDRRVGLAAAATLAIFPGYVLYAPLVLSEVTFVAAFTALLWLLVVLDARRPERLFPRWLGLGALMGVAILVRGTPLLFVGVVGLFAWITTRSFPVALRRTAVVALGIGLVTGPWAVRNYVTMGYPGLVTQQIGMPMTYSHSEVATGGMNMGMSRFRERLLREFRSLPQPQREIAEARAEVRRGLRYLWSHPGRELSLIPRRWYHFVKHDHTGMTWATERGPDGKPVRPVVAPGVDRAIARGADLFFWASLGVAAWGLARTSFAGRRQRWILPLCLAYFFTLHGVVVMGDPRFHAVLYPVLAVLCGAALLAPRPASAARAQSAR